jgi:SNF2 family DNA or RNA helicase
LKELNVQYTRLDGKSKDREEIIKKFNDDDNIDVFLISMRAGGFGLNLTKADTVILYDPWWIPMVEAQARDRAYRMGQTQNVNVYRLITKGTIEEKIQELKQKKSTLFDEVVGTSKDMFDKLSWDELKDILLQ